ncbi:MAG: hypothetical protein ACR2G5_06440 [Pyrinomonadaceae bacterium]
MTNLPQLLNMLLTTPGPPTRSLALSFVGPADVVITISFVLRVEDGT